jgi:acyl-CoA oxidase
MESTQRLQQRSSHTQPSSESASGLYARPSRPSLIFPATGQVLILLNDILSLQFDSVYNQAGQAAVIGTRYGVVRRQGPNDEQIMDFPSHYTSLMPIISLVYVSRLLWWQIGGEWGTLLRANLTAGTMPPPEKLMDFLVDMQDYHAAICGTKSWTSWAGADAIEQVRRTMGGHAYSAYNAVGSLFGDFAVTTTGAGDNIVLAQQSGRYNVQTLRRIRQGRVMGRLGPSVSYLQNFNSTRYEKFDLDTFKTSHTETRLNLLLITLRNLAGGLTSRALERVENEMKHKNISFDEACKSLMMDLLQVSKAQTSFYTLLKVLEFSYAADELKQSQDVKKIVLDVILLYALQQTINQFTEFLELGRALLYHLNHSFSHLNRPHSCIDLNVDATSYIRTLHSEICLSLRHICITLTDALGFPDEFIRAPLGRSDGDIYTAYFEQIMKSTKFRDHPDGPVAPYWTKLVAPLTSKTSSKL